MWPGASGPGYVIVSRLGALPLELRRRSYRRGTLSGMGIRTAVASLLKREPGEVRTRNIFGSQVAWLDPSTLTPAASGSVGFAIAANPESALAVPAVYRSIAMIQSSIAAMPWRSWDPTTNVIVDRQPTILRQPDPFQPRDTTLRQATSALLLYGEAYFRLGAFNSEGRPTLAIPIPNDEVRITWNDARTRARYHWRRVELFQYSTILHLKYLDVPGRLHGLGPIQMARQSVAGGVLADRMATDYYTSGNIVDGVLQAPERLAPGEAEKLAAQWEQLHAGSRSTAVLEGGMEFKQMTMNNSDAQFIEGRNFTVQDVARLFGIPPPLLNANAPGSSLQYRNQEGIATEYATFAVQPVTEVFESGFGMLIPSTQQLRFSFTQLLRADGPTRYSIYEKALNLGILSINEVRRLEGLAPVPDGGDIPETGNIEGEAVTVAEVSQP